MSDGDGLGTDTADGEFLADLFDTFLQDILDGKQPDLEACRRDRPDLGDRIQETWALACSVAGRREPSRPVLGGYEILRELGHGGMGTVYLARHQALQREVAIKVLPHSLAMSPHAKQRFLEEARALARLRHDHVVHVHRILDHAEMLAFEMEYVSGPSLRTLILALHNKARPQATSSLAEALGLPVEALGTRNTAEWFVRLGIKIARALGEVHRHGLVHRDVKPSNILLRQNGQPVLADFGLAREGDLDVTHASFAGTPVYAAPERLRSGDADLDARADVYSLGVTLYEAFSLAAPFGGKTTHEVLRRIEEGRLPSLRKRAPHVSRDLEIVIAKAMEPDRRHRYATADEFADDLERLLSLQPIHAHPAGALRRAWKFARRHQRLVLAAAAGAVLVTAVTWPVLAHARALTEARDRARFERNEARSRLLCPENLYSSWSPAHQGQPQQQLRMASVRDAQLAELERSLANYDLAVQATPDDGELVAERAAVRVVARLLRDEARGETREAIDAASLADLPPLTARLVRCAVEGIRVDDHSRRLVAAATATDRFCAGLFAFLRNDHDTSETCWHGLALPPTGQSFLNACLALQAISVSGQARAYPRLYQAVTDFPNATALAFAMADAAIGSNDLEVAEQWLRAIPETSGSSIARAQRKRLETDILAARGQVEAAQSGYLELAKGDASDPEPPQQLAALMLRYGSPQRARHMYRDIVRRWPDLAQPRLQLARLALQQRDLHAYLDSARFVMEQDLSRLAQGSAVQLADILRLGGLNLLHLELCATLEQPPGSLRADDAIPLATWLRTSQVAGISQVLRALRVFDRTFASLAPVEANPTARALRAAWHALVGSPSLATVLGWPAYACLLAAMPPITAPAAARLESILLPYQQALGNRMVSVRMPRLVQKELHDFDFYWGHQVERVGDLDGDTIEELCLTAPAQRGTTGGCLELRSLGDGSLLRTWEGGRGVLFAQAVTALGDVDGDLCNDLLIGSPLAALGGPWVATVSLRSGRTGNEIWSIEDDTPSFGAALANLGDLDGDGTDDFVVGVPPMRLADDERGRAVVYSGRSARPLYEVTCDRGGGWFGGAVANAGDANGDGVNDLLVGGNFGKAPGSVSLFDGRTGSLLSTFDEEDAAADFGQRVLGLGDVNGDGCADFAISAPGRGSGGGEPGKVHVLSGRTGRMLYELRGDRAGDGFGYSMCRMEWYRHPGEPAIAVAAHRGGPVGNGYVRVFVALNGEPVHTTAGRGPFLVGYSLVDLGDVDGDGWRDLGVSFVDPAGYGLWIMNYDQTPPEQRGR